MALALSGQLHDCAGLLGQDDHPRVAGTTMRVAGELQTLAYWLASTGAR